MTKADAVLGNAEQLFAAAFRETASNTLNTDRFAAVPPDNAARTARMRPRAEGLVEAKFIWTWSNLSES